jgi:hypothetical protein
MRETLSPSKEILSRLLATENIRVEHAPASTASFNVRDRILTLPLWKNTLDSDVLDMLIGHEVGHALWTRWEDWDQEQTHFGKKHRAIYRDYLNIIEDVRIERKIKATYPGLPRIFFSAYTKLVESGAFGVNTFAEMQSKSFLDRINCHFKIGSRTCISFSAEEQKIVDQIAKAETWDHVVKIARILWDFDLAEREAAVKKPKVTNPFPQSDPTEYDPSKDTISVVEVEDDDEGENEEEDDDEGENEEADDQSKVGGESDTSVEGEVDEGDASETSTAGGGSGPLAGDEDEDSEGKPKGSETLKAMEDHAKTLVDYNSYPFQYVFLPKIDPSKFVVPVKVTQSILQQEIYSAYSNTGWVDESRQNVYSKFMLHTRKYVNLLVKEFEMKRTAKRVLRTRVSRSGRLDTNKLHNYRLTEDIFLQQNITPDGQSHGMLMLIDFSGSMYDSIGGTVEQVIILSMFCRQAQIPFRVYGFFNNGSTEDMVASGIRSVTSNVPDAESHDDYITKSAERRKLLQEEMPNDPAMYTIQITDPNFRLKELITSDMRPSAFTEGVKNLLFAASKNFDYTPSISLSSTPYLEGILVLRRLADQYKTKFGVDVMNTIFLTDGAATSKLGYNSDRMIKSYYGGLELEKAWDMQRNRVVFVDPDTNQSEEVSSWSAQAALLRLYAKATGSRTMGYFLISGRGKYMKDKFMEHYAAGVAHDLEYQKLPYEVRDSMVKNSYKQFQKNRYCELRSNEYQKYFVMPSGSALKVSDGKINTYSKDPKAIKKAFKEAQEEKHLSKMFLSRFIEAIA